MRSWRILVVEDDALVALNLREQLAALGYLVVGHARSGDEALRLIGETTPDLVLMDVNIDGEIDGIETASRIPAGQDLPVIFLTGRSEEAILQRARGARPYGFLTKPYSERELHATIQMALERRQVAAALRESEDRLALAVDTYELGIVDLDPLTGTTVVSSTMERIVGVEAGSLSGPVQKWQPILLPTRLDQTLAEVAEDIEARLTRRPHQLFVQQPSGELRELRGVRRYFYDSDGECRRVMGLYMDVTDQVRDRAELDARGARLMELQGELNHVSRLGAMGALAAAIAHEINQPLTAVATSVGTIRLMLAPGRGPLDDVGRERLLQAAEHAETQAVRAGLIIRKLREFLARGEAETREETLEQLVEDALALALPNPSAVNIEVRRDLASAASHVMADGVQVQQILINLIRNAVEAMRDQTTPRILTFSAAAQDGMATITVADSGPGVPPDVAERLFTPFMSSKPDGMGVGLSICRRIAEAHGGKMWLEPSKGHGAVFHFTLPLADVRDRASGSTRAPA
jgi:two-component system sensor kinase FixL